jgi:hypothetical protein
MVRPDGDTRGGGQRPAVPQSSVQPDPRRRSSQIPGSRGARPQAAAQPAGYRAGFVKSFSDMSAILRPGHEPSAKLIFDIPSCQHATGSALQGMRSSPGALECLHGRYRDSVTATALRLARARRPGRPRHGGRGLRWIFSSAKRWPGPAKVLAGTSPGVSPPRAPRRPLLPTSWWTGPRVKRSWTGRDTGCAADQRDPY